MTYRYQTIKQSPTRFTLTDMPGHIIVFVKRIDNMESDRETRSEFLPKCTCGWKGERWVRTKKHATVQHAKHLVEASKQLSLFA